MQLSETHQEIRQTARRFAEQAIRPQAEALDRDESFPHDLYKQMGKLGLFGITTPAELGGSGLDTLSYALVMEELSRGYSSVADQCGLYELIGTLLSVHGTADQQDKWLKRLLSAELRPAYCITEAEAGTDVSGIRTAAERTATGWRLSGSKLWIHNAPVADVGFVLARTDKAAGKRGMSIFIVPFDAPGVSRGPKEHKMGQRASQVGALHFENVDLPDDALLGAEGRGFP